MGVHWQEVKLGSQHVESLKRKYGVSMQIVSYQRACSESDAALILCRYYLGAQVAVMAAKAAAFRAVFRGEVYWRERERRMLKDKRKQVLAAEEMTATETQSARMNGAASATALTE